MTSSTRMITGGMVTDKLSPLIDGDVLVYRCGFSADSQMKREAKERGLSPEETEEFLAETDYTNWAIGNTKTSINDLVERFGGKPRIFLTGDGNFREQLATILPYKGNRTGAKPKYYRDIKDYLLHFKDAELIHGREADDAMGCIQWAAKDRSTIICTIDKDLDMIPGWHYNFMHNEQYGIHVKEANLWLFQQMLLGDRVDNIPGIHNVGEKRTAALLEENDHDLFKVRDAVQALYRKQYGEDWEAAYNEVADLLWIERIEGKKCPFLF